MNLGLMAWLGFYWYGHYRNRYLDQAEQAAIEGDTAVAIRAYRTHLRHRPSDADAAGILQQLEKEYRTRFLEKAEAHLKVGDQVAAIGEYRSHIEHYPGDHEVQLKLAKLYEQLGINDSAESIYRGIIKDLEGSGGRIEAIARERLLRHVNSWANDIKRRADKLFLAGEFEAAAGEYAKVIRLRSRNPALVHEGVGNRRAVAALNNVIAKRAFSLWRSGREDALRSELVSPQDARVFAEKNRDGRPPAEVMRQREVMLANLFWDYADRQFEAEHWQSAADLYRRTLQMRLQAQGGEDPNTPTLLFNYALSEYRAGNPDPALDALERIQRDYAYHEKAAVRQLKQQLEEAVKE